MVEEDEIPNASAFEEPEVESPMRAEMALCTMCVAVLRRIPSLERIEAVRIKPVEGDGGPNWELASTTPALTARQWALAVKSLQPWRERYVLAGTNATKGSSNRRRTPLAHRDLPPALRRERQE